MKILGIQMTSHETGVALIVDGKIVAVAEERLNREKYSGKFPAKSIEYCLKAFNVKPEEIDHIVTDWTGTGRDREHGAVWESYIREKTGGVFTRATITAINHHTAHAATAYYCSPFQDAAILIYDGKGDRFTTHLGINAVETETFFRGSGDVITQVSRTAHGRMKKHTPYTTGIGNLYNRFSHEYLGFGARDAGKMMGLAAYGDDRLLKQFPFEMWCKEYFGQWLCNGKFSANQLGWRRRLANAILIPLLRKMSFGYLNAPPIFEEIVLPEPPLSPERQKGLLPDKYYSSVAYMAQHIFERFAVAIATNLRRITGSQNLCVAGGCGLNIDANRRFFTDAGFTNVFIQPASSDSGIALGCALWGWHVIAKEPRISEMKNASLGRSYSDKEIETALAARTTDVVSRKVGNIAVETAKILAEGKIVGWFQGGSEYGPRALGYRSIICDPRGPKAKETLNLRVKHRENWRPFAASVLLEKMSEWFDIDVPSPFMLLMANVTKKKMGQIPAVTHVDGTCRLQSLTKDANGLYYDLVKAFDALTGVPMLLNTSFNLAGEPIVETPEDAVRTFLATDFDCLVLGNYIVTKS